MTDKYRLHFAPDNASVIIRIALDELGAAYETVLVDRSVQAQSSAAYRALNPLGLIPALETGPHGTSNGVIFETAAIGLWLSDGHGRQGRHGRHGPNSGEGADLMPHPQDAARGDALKWLFFLSGTVHTNLRQMFYPEKYICTQSAPALRDGLATALRTSFGHVDAQIADDACACLGGAQLSFLDIYACVLFRWAQIYPQTYNEDWIQAARYPALRRLARAVEARPSVQAAQRAEGLGPTPFSNPVQANPPIGSAT